jgi:hypothetical protein
MSPKQQQEEAERRAAYIALTGLFGAIFVAFTSRLGRKHRTRLDLRPMDLALLGVSTYRLGRLAAYDKVLEPYRQPFAKTVPDETGAGDTVEPRGQGARRALGELISCPICAGTWIAAGLVYALHLAPGATRVFMTIMGSIGIGELLNALTEALSWSGQAARSEAGTTQAAPKRRLHARTEKARNGR